MKNINDLPDLCLRTIFSKLPLRNLLRIDQVCLAWERIQPSVCLMRKELTILIGIEPEILIQFLSFTIPYYDELIGNQFVTKDDSELQDQNELKFDWLDGASANRLTRLLPNLDTVCIAIRYVCPVIRIGVKSWGVKATLTDNIIVLLRKWSHKMKTLKLYITFVEAAGAEKQIEGDIQKLLCTINSECQSLRHLTLKLKNSFFFQNLNDKKVDLPILGRLEEFYLEFQNDMSVVSDSLDKYAKNAPQLRVLAIDGILQDSVDSGALLRYDAKLAQKFTQLPDLVFSEANFAMSTFCTLFHRLERLRIKIEFHVSKIYKFIKMIQPLKSLIYLEIYFQVNINEHDEDVDEVNRRRAVEEEEYRMIDFESIPQLPSVKIIEISASLRSHDQLDSIQWDRMFPNLEILNYLYCYLNCSICEPRNENNENNTNQEQQNNEPENPVNNDPENDENQPQNEEIVEEEKKLNKCLKLALQPWKHCPKLHSVYTDVYEC